MLFFFLCINEMFLKSFRLGENTVHMNYTRQNQPPLTKITNIYEGKKDNVAVPVLLLFFIYFPVNMTPIISHFNSAPL